MPRFANGSLEKAIYGDIQAVASGKYVFGENPAKKERKNSTHSRAATFQGFVVPDPVTCADRIGAIRGVLKLVERGFCTMENAVTIIHNITKGE